MAEKNKRELTKLDILLEGAMEVNLLPYLIGPHGIGKTERVGQFAKANGMELITIEGSTLKEGEITGLPLNIKQAVSQDKVSLAELVKVVTKYVGANPKEDVEIDGNLVLAQSMIELTNTLRQEEDVDGVVLTYSKYFLFQKVEQLLKDGKKVLLFIDEVNRVPKEVQQELMNFCQKKVINTTDFSGYKDTLFIVLAGNPSFGEHDYEVTDFNPAFMDRLMPYEMTVDSKEWMDWATENKIDGRILQFIDKNKDKLHSWKSDEKLRGATPRAWVELHKFIKNKTSKEVRLKYRQVVEGIIGKDVGSIFVTAMEHMKPLFPEIFLNGGKIEEGETAIRQSLSAKLAINEYMEKHMEKPDGVKKLANFVSVLKDQCKKEVKTAIACEMISKTDKYAQVNIQLYISEDTEAMFKILDDIANADSQVK